jgi:hypothetical protein
MTSLAGTSFLSSKRAGLDAQPRRSAFFFQIPVVAISFVLVALKVDIKLPNQAATTREKLARVDWLGSFTIVGTVGSLLLGFSLKTGEELPWAHPWVWGLLVASVVFGLCFIIVETKIAKEPVLPMRLLFRRTPLAVALANL